jgi:hypothetical protein
MASPREGEPAKKDDLSRENPGKQKEKSHYDKNAEKRIR